MYSSAAAGRLVDEILGKTGEVSRTLPKASGPTLVKLEDPLIDIDEAVSGLDAESGGKRPNPWLKKRHGREILDMRVCCLHLAQQLDSRLAVLAIPSAHECPTCGTKWEIRYLVREERHHG